MNVRITVKDARDRTGKRRYARRIVEYSNTLITTSSKEAKVSDDILRECLLCLDGRGFGGETGSRKKNVRVHA